MKTLFIPQLKIQFSLYEVDKLGSRVTNLVWLGLVNSILGDKANAKEIVSVDVSNKVNSFGEIVHGYTVTYLESEMIADLGDLRLANLGLVRQV